MSVQERLGWYLFSNMKVCCIHVDENTYLNVPTVKHAEGTDWCTSNGKILGVFGLLQSILPFQTSDAKSFPFSLANFYVIYNHPKHNYDLSSNISLKLLLHRYI